MTNPFVQQLAGGDLRSIGASNAIVQEVKNQQDFDLLFACVAGNDRLVAMRSMDAVEKITRGHPAYLLPQRNATVQMLENEAPKEIRWPLALLLPRIKLTKAAMGKAWHVLTSWALDKKESRIVRVKCNSGIIRPVAAGARAEA